MTDIPQTFSANLMSRKERVVLGFVAIWQIFSPAQALADAQFSLDASAGVGISTNPFLTVGPSTASGSANIALQPTITVREASGDFRLSGSVRHIEYFKRYNSTDNFDLNAAMNRRLSSQTNFRAAVGFESSIVGNNDIFFNPIPSGDGLDPVLPPVADDIGLNGLRQRRASFRGSAGVVHKVSSVDQISLDFSGSLVRYPSGTALQEYDYYGENFGYSRTLNDRLSLGASVGVARTNYLRTGFGDARVISPQLTFTARLNARWTLSGSGGVSITRTNGALGYVNSTALAGSLSACNKAGRANFCLTASRSALPSSLNGIRTQTSVGASYAYRVDELTDVSLSGSYSRASQPFLGGSRGLEYANAGLTVNRRFSPRLTAFVSGGYADSFEQSVQRRANLQLNGGVRYRFGSRR